MDYPIDEKMRSPMFLPERFARYFIRITDVRAERVQEISLDDIEREGFPPDYAPSKSDWYGRLWDSINPKYPWSSNCWVFAYTFRQSIKESVE